MLIFDKMNAFLDERHNIGELRKSKLVCGDFPTINGRIMVASFAKDGFGTLKIAKGVIINSSVESNPVGGSRSIFIFKHSGGIIEIDESAGMSNVLIAAYEHVYIGKNVNIGAGTKIFDTDFHSVDFEERMKDINIPHRPVHIGHGAFIGADTIILKGVTIGDYSVIGAGSVVAKSVPPGEIWGGNPAKFIRKL